MENNFDKELKLAHALNTLRDIKINPNYFLEISIDIKEPIASLSIGEKKYIFDPRTVLSDLTFDKKIENSKIDDAVVNTQNSQDYKYEYAFDKLNPIYINEMDRDTYVSVWLAINKLIKESLITRKVIDIKSLIVLKTYFSFPLNIVISNTKEANIDEHLYSSLNYSEAISNRLKYRNNIPFCPDTLDVDEALLIGFSNFTDYSCICSSLAETIFAIMYFLALGKYKFSKCNHCEKVFATTTYKQLYCFRKSPYPNYEHLNCNDAVKNIKQKLRRTRRKIAKNLEENQFRKYEAFRPKSKELINKVVKHPTPKNIDDACEYINADRWYIRRSKKK